MKETIIQYPESLTAILELSEEELATEFRFLLAGKLYELGKLTSGRAAEMAQVSRVEFLSRLSAYGFQAINLSGDEVEREIEAAEASAR